MKKAPPNVKPPKQVRDAQAYIDSQVIRGTLDEADPRIISSRKIIRPTLDQAARPARAKDTK